MATGICGKSSGARVIYFWQHSRPFTSLQLTPKRKSDTRRKSGAEKLTKQLHSEAHHESIQ
jgi:hypothetical protein